MNRVILVGYLTKEPEVRLASNGKTVASFTLAVSEGGRSSLSKFTQYIDCVAWGEIAETLQSYTKKSCKLLVVGSLHSVSWFKPDGSKAYKIEVSVREIELLTSKVDSQRLNKTNFDGGDGENGNNFSNLQLELPINNSFEEIEIKAPF